MAIDSSHPLTPDSASEPLLVETQETYSSATQYWRDPIEEHKEWFSNHGLSESDVVELLATHNRIEIEVEEDVWFLDRLKAFLLENYGNTRKERLHGKISDHMMFHFKKTILEERDTLKDSADNTGSIYSMKVSGLLPESGPIRDDWYSFLRTKSANSIRYVLKDIIPWLVERIQTLEAERNTTKDMATVKDSVSSPRKRKTNRRPFIQRTDKHRVKKSVKRKGQDTLTGTRKSQRIMERRSRVGAV